MTTEPALLDPLPDQASEQQTTPPAQRRRGGQPSNQNARRHGFYAGSLTPQEQEALWQAVDLKDLLSEIALMRVKLMDLVSYPDTPPDLLIRAARTLTRMVDVQHKVTMH